ncbi:hypothetical protein OG889_29015 [Streptomyces sp. NBC_00481]|uniref:hypothetical protein n=1 Tax=unclassified Streptomyces TaxID=2593676 RepID=UPI002DD8D617|nr:MULTISPECIES: hypothetical protein [unclassified Streptomyces]WRY98386.1 hypothetical protein OG889_29015 [Streptomyces sp. NBC_00481]
MAQAGDWQRDVLRELGRQDRADGGDAAAPGSEEAPARRAEPTLRLVRSAPTDPPEPTATPAAPEPPEAPEPPGSAQGGGGDRSARPAPAPAPAHGTPAGQPPAQPAFVAQPPVRVVADPPVREMPVVRQPVQRTPGAPPPGQPAHVAQALGQPGHIPQAPGQPGHIPQAPGQPGHIPQAPGQPAHVAPPPGQPGPTAQPPGQLGPTAQPPGQPGHVAQPPVQPGAHPPVVPPVVQPSASHTPAVDPRTGLPWAAAQPPGAPGAPGAPGDADRAGQPGGYPPPGPGESPAAPVPRGSRVPQTPVPAPDSVPTIDPRLAHALGRPQHGESVARRTGRSIRKLTSSAAQDVAEETRIARELQQPVTTGRVIAVTSIRGGVGKSTMAALLGRTFNHYRHDPVLTMEADAALGTLPVRMGADSVRWAAGDLAQILNPAMQLTDVTGYLVPVSDGGWLLPGSQGRVGAPLDIRTYRTVTLALRRYFAVTVVDCETLPGEVARTAMDTAHARVVVAPMTAEGVNGTRQVLDWLGQLPHSALSSTVVALTAGSPDVTLDLRTAVAHLKESGVHVVPVPYDRHLAQGGPIRTALLGQETREAAITLAAEAMTRAVRMR